MPTFREIPTWTRTFLESGVGVDAKGKSLKFNLDPKTVAVPGEDAPLEIVRCQPADGRVSYWVDEDKEKQRIVLHNTVGSVKGDVGSLVDRGHLSVAYLIAEDGTILELFDPTKWSYHLGMPDKDDNKVLSSTSIGIELCNYGPLKREGDRLLNDYGSAYCHISETEAYVEAPLRDKVYFARFPDAQVAALGRLLRFLTDRFGIPAEFLPEDQRFEWLDAQTMTRFRGICSHLNFRGRNKRGNWDKWDIGPALDWRALEAAVRVETQPELVVQEPVVVAPIAAQAVEQTPTPAIVEDEPSDAQQEVGTAQRERPNQRPATLDAEWKQKLDDLLPPRNKRKARKGPRRWRQERAAARG